MYLSFYKLKEFPFSLTFERKFFYESASHAEALANMTYTIQQRKGMVLITGEVGSGKTFVGNLLAGSLGVGCTTVLLKHPPRSEKQLLRSLAKELGISPPPDADEISLVEELQQHLVRMHGRGRLFGLIIDEAQDLSEESLEQIRLLWNWEQDGQRLLQIVLIGQPELREKLREPKWESLRQRIVLSYHLGRLSAEETDGYISHRLSAAGEDGCLAEFTPEAKAEIHAATRGIPRLINVVCDNALLRGYTNGVHRIDREIVAKVLADRTRWGLQKRQEDEPAEEEPAPADADVAAEPDVPVAADDDIATYDLRVHTDLPVAPLADEVAVGDSGQGALAGRYEPVRPIPTTRLMTTCPHCHTSYEIRRSKIGKPTRCRACGRRFKITVAAESHNGAG